MHMISYIIWNGSSEIFSFGSLTLRWYGLLFALGFLISQQLLYYIYRKENKPERDVETLTIYMVVATIVGARLGHVIFYQPDMFLTDPLGIFLPFQFSPTFKFTGLQGLASHGGAFGILFALWLYSRKKKPGQSYLQILDRIVILVALTGCLIRLGNFFNSEIIGKPTDSPTGVVFTGRVTEAILRNPNNLVETIGITKDDESSVTSSGQAPIQIYLFFKKGISREAAENYVRTDVKYILTHLPEFVNESPLVAINYEIVSEAEGSWVTKVHTFGIVRHPAQLYESISCLFLFAFLFWYWHRYQLETPPGRIFGLFLVILWSLRFAYEFLKENQEAFEGDLPINMGQILSIPLVLAGIYVLIRSYQKPSNKQTLS
ncbi:MAG: prolipoprotein diacylglyceryl transferase [Bacteroidia bacterium]|nr:prolipoprotein diacylglyceryl transferase [Bacteroidia bacterium]